MKVSRQALIALGITGAGLLSAEEVTREQLDTLLGGVAQTSSTSEPVSALCYVTVPVLMRIDYLCPLCKTKTLHEKEGNVPLVDEKIREYRQQIKRIKELGVEAVLDETDLCGKCRRDKKTKTATLSVIVWRKDRAIRTRLETHDLTKVIAFLEDKDVWLGGAGGVYSLQSELPRIRQILGMDEEGKKEKKQAEGKKNDK